MNAAPWRAGKPQRLNTAGETYAISITDANGNAVATVHNTEHANLIAAAPELFESLYAVPHIIDQAISALELLNDLATPKQEWGALRGRLENAKQSARAALAKVSPQ